MEPADHSRQGFIDVKTIAEMFRLSGGQKLKLAQLIASDPKLGGVRNDGSMPVAQAIRFVRAAMNKPC